MKKKEDYVVIYEKWAPIALEYAKFLNRYKMKTISVITGAMNIGFVMAVYADEKRYLKLATKNKKFIEEEKHMMHLLDTIQTMYTNLREEASRQIEELDELEELDDDEL